MRVWALAAAAVLTFAAACSSSDPASAPLSTTSGTARAAGPGVRTPAQPSADRTTERGAPSAASATGSATAASITISAIGDVLPHRAVNNDAATGAGFDYDSMFAAVRPTIQESTVSICQLETALSADNTQLTQGNTFNSPRELARTLASVGFDGCSTANNHTWDAGLRGVRETREVLSANGIRAAGPTDTAAGSGAPARYDTTIPVAHLAYSYTLMNSIERDTTTTPPGAPWMTSNLYAAQQADGIIDAARRAKAAGAEVVVVSLHWGSQFDPAITRDQSTLGSALLRSGAVDLIIGAHPHLIQPCAKINGRYVLYSVGNFLSTQGTAVGSPVGAQDGVIATVRFTRGRDGAISQSLTYQPTWVDRAAGHRVVPATPTSHADSYRRTVSAMSQDGCDATVMG